MSTPKARAVQVPGEPAQQTQADQIPDQQEIQQEEQGAEVADPEKEALRAQLAALQDQLAKSESAAAAKKSPAKEEAAAPQVAGGARKTDQGWIVPDSFGSPAKKG